MDLNRIVLAMLLLFLTGASRAADLAEGLALFDNKQYLQAKEIMVKLAGDNPGNARFAYYAGRSLFRAREFEQAIEYLEKAAQLKEQADVYYLLGVAYISRVGEVNLFRKLGMVKKAKAAWIKTLQLDQSHLRSRYALASFYLNAPAIAGGDLDEAQRQLAILDVQHPDYAIIVKAILKEKEGKIEEAYKSYREAEQRITDRAFPPFNTAQFLYRQKRYEEALAALNRYTGLQKAWDDPAELFVHLVRGNIYADQNDADAARRELTTALALNPDKSLVDLIEQRLADL